MRSSGCVPRRPEGCMTSSRRSDGPGLTPTERGGLPRSRRPAYSTRSCTVGLNRTGVSAASPAAPFFHRLSGTCSAIQRARSRSYSSEVIWKRRCVELEGRAPAASRVTAASRSQSSRRMAEQRPCPFRALFSDKASRQPCNGAQNCPSRKGGSPRPGGEVAPLTRPGVVQTCS